MALFVDTSALYAVVDVTDPNHAAAAGRFADLLEADPVTHNYVAIELVSLLQRRSGAGASVRAIQELLPAIAVTWVARDLHHAAESAFLAAESRSVSFVDRVSFELMRRDGIETAFAFDADFERAGFETIP